jgi:hypothetical protein
MQIKILGWAGGIGANLRTTSFLIDDDMLIDAGTGLGDLPLNQMTGIRHIFLTHSHMDHIAGLPLLADSMFGVHDEPIVVHAQEKTIEAIKKHIFNWIIWPDFSELPTPESPSIHFEVMRPRGWLLPFIAPRHRCLQRRYHHQRQPLGGAQRLRKYRFAVCRVGIFEPRRGDQQDIQALLPKIARRRHS